MTQSSQDFVGSQMTPEQRKALRAYQLASDQGRTFVAVTVIIWLASIALAHVGGESAAPWRIAILVTLVLANVFTYWRYRRCQKRCRELGVPVLVKRFF